VFNLNNGKFEVAAFANLFEFYKNMTRKPHLAKRGLPLVGGDEGERSARGAPQILHFRVKDFILYRFAVSAAMPPQPCAGMILSSREKYLQTLSDVAPMGGVGRVGEGGWHLASQKMKQT